MTDPIEYSSNLTASIDKLSQSQESWARSFGSLGSAGNAWWTIFARVTSGSGLWKLQNRVRAVSNVFEAFTKSSDDASKAMVKSLESSLDLYESFKKLQKEAAKKGKDNPIFKMFIDDLGDAGHDPKMKKSVQKYVDRIYDNQINAFKKQQKKRGKALAKALRPGFGERFDDFMGDQKMFGGRFNYTGKALQFAGKEALSPLKKMGGMNDAIFGKKDISLGGRFRKSRFGETLYDKEGKRRRHAAGTKGRAGFIKTQMKNAKSLTKIFPMAGKFLTMAVAGLGTFLMYGLLIVVGITILAAIIKKGWPVMKDYFIGSFKFFKAAAMNVIGIIMGIFNLFKAIFRGDVVGAVKIFFNQIFLNLVKLLLNLLAGVFTILVGLIHGLMVGIGNGMIALINKIPGIDIKHRFGKKFAQGGVSQGGLVEVGEHGRELIQLPRGARIHNNANSSTMNKGASNIHVHINGRVGASDAEIKDIANKVAREINLRMNRTGATRIGA